MDNAAQNDYGYIIISSLAEPRLKICDPHLSYIKINMYVFGNIRPGKDLLILTDSDWCRILFG